MLEHIPYMEHMGVGSPKTICKKHGNSWGPRIESVMKSWELKKRPFDGGPRMRSSLGPGNTVLSLIGYITLQ